MRLVCNLAGHVPSGVRSISISRDGKILASGSNDKTVKLWSLDTGKLIGNLSGHSRIITSVAINPNGQTVASCDGGTGLSAINLWDLKTGKLIRTLSGDAAFTNSVTFSPDGEILASGGLDKTIKIWKAKTGKLIRTLSGEPLTPVDHIAISPDRSTVVSCSNNFSCGNNNIKIWNLNTGKLLRNFSVRMPPLGFAISPDWQIIASSGGGIDNTTQIWNLATGNLIKTYPSNATSLGISPDGQILACGTMDRTIKLWNLKTDELIGTLSGHSAPINSFAFSPNGQVLISGGGEERNNIKIWALSSSPHPLELQNYPDVGKEQETGRILSIWDKMRSFLDL